MKKIYIIFALIAASMIMVSCQKELPITFSAIIEDYEGDGNKAHLNDTYKVEWTEGDEVAITNQWDKMSGYVTLDGEVAEVIMPVNHQMKIGSGINAIYPARWVKSPNTIMFPYVQHYRWDDELEAPMLAFTVLEENNNLLKFYNAGALMMVKMKNINASEIEVKEIQLEATTPNRYLSGAMSYSQNINEAPKIFPKAGNNQLSKVAALSFVSEGLENGLPLPPNVPFDATIVLPPVESAFSLTIIYSVNGEWRRYTQRSETVNHIERNKIFTMGVEIGEGVAFNGSGTAEDPYMIRSAADFNTRVVEACNASTDGLSGTYFKQYGNIDITTTTAWTKAFKGHYDGNNYRINYANLDEYNAMTGSLFDQLGEGASVKNIQLYAWIEGNDDEGIGGIVGYVNGKNVVIDNCWLLEDSFIKNSSTIGSCGGICGACNYTNGGASDNLTIKNCVIAAECSVEGGAGCGGAIGRITVGKAVVANCAIHGTIGSMENSTSYVGGIIGINNDRITIANSYFDGIAQTAAAVAVVDGKNVYKCGGIIGQINQISGNSNYHTFRNIYVAGEHPTNGDWLCGDWSSENANESAVYTPELTTHMPKAQQYDSNTWIIHDSSSPLIDLLNSNEVEVNIPKEGWTMANGKPMLNFETITFNSGNQNERYGDAPITWQ